MWTGSHVQRISENPETVAQVLTSKPDLYSGYIEFGNILRRLHYLTKAKRWLTEEEVKEIEQSDLKFVATVATGGRVKFLSAVLIFPENNAVSYIFCKFTHTLM